MDEACGGYASETNLAENVTKEFDDEWQHIEFAANGEEYEQSLRDEIEIYRKKMQVLEKENLEKEKEEYSDLVRKVIGGLLDKREKLETEVTGFRVRATELENEVERMKSKSKNDLLAEVEELTNMSLAFKAIYEEAKRVGAIHHTNSNMPLHIRLHSWRGIVSETPHFAWIIDNMSHDQKLKKKFFVAQYKFQCIVAVQLLLPSVPGPRQPFFRVFVQPEKQGLLVIMPMIVAVIKREECENSRVERLDALHFNGSSYQYGCCLPADEPMPVGKRCARLKIELFFELPRSTKSVQSDNGVLYWTVEKVGELFQQDREILYSPRFVVEATGHLLRAILYRSTTENELNLFVVRLSSSLLLPCSNYSVTVIVFKPKPRPGSKSSVQSRRSDLKQGVNFVLGKSEDVVASDTFSCKVVVVREPPKGE